MPINLLGSMSNGHSVTLDMIARNKYIAKGKKTGRAEGLLEIAKEMVKKGIYSLEEITENLNLPLNEVQALSAQMS